MRRTNWLVLVALLALAAGSAKAQFLGPGWWKTAAPASYVGPGDVVPLTWWIGMRAYSAATRGQAAVNICSESGGVDVTCEDELTSATTGKLVLGTVGSTCASVACTVHFWYDQTGNNACSSAPCNFGQTLVSDRATFLITGCPDSGQPCASFTAANTNNYNGSGASVFSQPYSVTMVAYKTPDASLQIAIYPGNFVFAGFSSTANTVAIYAGTELDSTSSATDGALHSIQAIYNGSSSSIYVDGTQTTGDAGTGSVTFPGCVGGNNCNGNNNLGGYLLEGGFNSSPFSAGTAAALTSNQRTFWGF